MKWGEKVGTSASACKGWVKKNLTGEIRAEGKDLDPQSHFVVQSGALWTEMAQQTTMSSDLSKPEPFLGEFRHGIDPKNRITIPSAWRSKDREESRFHLLVDSSKSFIIAIPPEEYLKKLSFIENHPEWNEARKQIVARGLTSATKEGFIDKQGRMVLPTDFCTMAGLTGDVFLVGSNKRFEIWNPAKWDALQAENAEMLAESKGELGL